MTDVITEPTDQQPEPKDSRDFANMRRRAEQAEAEVGRLRTIALNNALELKGYDPKDELVQLVVEKFNSNKSDDGTLPDPTAEAFAEFATARYPKLQPTAPVDEPTGSREPTAVEQRLAELQEPGDRLRDASRPVEPADRKQQIAEAEEKEDWATSISLKNEQVAALAQRQAP